MAIAQDLSDLPRAESRQVGGWAPDADPRFAQVLVPVPAPVRVSDPATSQQAAVMAHLPAQRLAVLTALVALGEATAWDIARRLDGPESGTVRSRLSQLHRSGHAAKVGVAAGDRGAANTLWTATVSGRELVAALGGPSVPAGTVAS